MTRALTCFSLLILACGNSPSAPTGGLVDGKHGADASVADGSATTVPGVDAGRLPDGGLCPAPIADPALVQLHAAEIALANAPHDPQQSRAVTDASLGICEIRGGAGLYLAPVKLSDQPSCLNACISFQASHPNRTCIFKGNVFVGDPARPCIVKGGALQVVANHGSLTQAQCTSACDATTDPFRSCEWGTDRIRHPAPSTECRVTTGLGATTLRFTDAAGCQTACDQQTDPYRRCTYGSQVLRERDPATKCEIIGGVAKVLAPAFWGTPNDCAARCATFAATNPNRFCFYGATRLP